LSEHLYLHIPFCLKKCRYCDFYSETDLSRVDEYASALIREIQLRSETRDSWGRAPVKTIYFGGGTPSVLPLSSLETVMETLHQYCRLSDDAEITLEANPGTLDQEYLTGLSSLGINRLSIGVQSFDDERLALLGRIHSGDEAGRAIKWARAAGFENIGLDLIYGLPGETRLDWEKQMDAALAFCPEHLSCYMLTLEPGTPLYHRYEKGLFTPMAGEAQVDLFTFTSEYLVAGGYDHYEISNFAHGKENQSRHNCAYWEMLPYTGFGPSAHSYWIQGERGRADHHIRFWNLADLDAYTRSLAEGHLPVDSREILTPSQQMLERIMVGLRTGKGLDIDAFDILSKSSFQMDYRELVLGLEKEKLGQITEDGKGFILTRAGWARLDNIIERFARDLPLKFS